MKDLRDELSGEIEIILANDFEISVANTSTVPSSNDGGITFPNLDAKSQSCKLIETCVLYIDIRRSTELNLAHRPKTVAKLYSAFVRAMTKCARHYGGHVRGIIGDRVMVIYDEADAFANAVNTAILMNSTAKYLINKHFTKNEIACGIGIDAGRILATKTGFRRRGVEQYNYKSLVWLGRPANVASKLTDLANKEGETIEYQQLSVGYDYGDGRGYSWLDQTPQQYLAGFTTNYNPRSLVPTSSAWRAHIFFEKSVELRADTPPILMTKFVYDEFKKAKPNDRSILNGWFKNVSPLKVSGYDGDVYGGDVIFTAFRD